MKTLPGWALLSLSIAGVLIIGLATTTLTLVGQLRQADKTEIMETAKHSDAQVIKDVTYIREKINCLDNKIDSMNNENRERNHTISKLVMLMCIPFKERQGLLEKYKDYYAIPKFELNGKK